MHPFVYIKNWREERRARKEQETPADRAARVTANATVWMAVFTLFLFLLNGATVWILKNQLKEMHEGGIDTHALAQASSDAASAASDQADAAQQFSDTTDDINKGISSAGKQLEASANNTRTTIRNAQTQFQDEQRAWVGVEGTSPSEGFTETEPWKVTVIFFNSGRTPARNVQLSMMFISSMFPLSGPTKEQIAQLAFRPSQSIAPQGHYRASLSTDFAPESKTESQQQGQQVLISQYKLIKDKLRFLYYFGILKYDDVFGNHRETQYCIFLADPNTKAVGVCDGFNDLN